jgi:hypothetical protein
VDFGILGPLEIHEDGSEVVLRAAKPRGLLALLLLAPGPCCRPSGSSTTSGWAIPHLRPPTRSSPTSTTFAAPSGPKPW